MKVISILVLSWVANAASYIPPSDAFSLNAITAGAKCDGVTDDTPALQAAINSLSAHAGGGTLILPGATCLLNSYTQDNPATGPFFRNLLVPSNVFIQGS